MAANAVQSVLGRAVTDSEFRKMLRENPGEALTGYDLSDEEKDALMHLDAEKVDGLAQSLDDRITKGFSNIG